MIADLSVKGPAATIQRYLITGGTNIKAGEPIHSVYVTYTSGVLDGNTFVLAAADTPVVGTHRFGGVAIKNSTNVAAGTVAEQFLPAACPVPNVGRILGKAETKTSVDTLTELALLIGDLVLIDYDSTGGSDGGELYTIKVAGSADTSGLELIYGNTATQVLEVAIVPAAYRSDFA